MSGIGCGCSKSNRGRQPVLAVGGAVRGCCTLARNLYGGGRKELVNPVIPLKKWFRSPGRDPGAAREGLIRVESRIPGSNGAQPPDPCSNVPGRKGSRPRSSARANEAAQPDPMDRPLDPAFRRRRRLKQIARSLAGLAALVCLLVWLPGWIRPAVDSDRIRTALVQPGAVEGDDHRFRHGGAAVRADPLQSRRHPSRADSAQTGGPAAEGRADRRPGPERRPARGRETGGTAGPQAEPAHPARAGGAQEPQRPGDGLAPQETGPGAPADPHRPVPPAAGYRSGLRGAASPGPARGGARRHRAAAARREPPQTSSNPPGPGSRPCNWR